jgi:hypothetical protein
MNFCGSASSFSAQHDSKDHHSDTGIHVAAERGTLAKIHGLKVVVHDTHRSMQRGGVPDPKSFGA